MARIITEDQLDAGPLKVTEGQLDPLSEDVVRPRLSISGELGGGLKEIKEAVGGFVKSRTEAKPSGNKIVDLSRQMFGLTDIQNLLRGGLGAARAAASPFAPLSNSAAKAGEEVSKATREAPILGARLPGGITLSDALAAGTEALVNVLGAGAASKLAGLTKAAAVRRFPFRKEIIQKVGQEFAAKEGLITQASEKAIKRTGRLTEEQVTQVRQAERSVQGEVSRIEDLKSAQVKQVREAAETAKTEIPSAESLKKEFAFGAPTTEQAGQRFISETYPQKFVASRQRFNSAYEDIIRQGDTIETSANSTLAKVESIVGEQGIKDVLPTKAERVAKKIKQALSPEDEADDVFRGVQANMRSAEPSFVEALKAAKIKEGLLSTESEGTTVGNLIRFRHRLRSAQRASAPQPNIARQFDDLQKAVTDDITQAEGNLADNLSQVDKAYVTEHLPFYGKGSAIREAVEESPASLVDRIIRPASDPDRVQKAQLGLSLVEDDPIQKKSIVGAWMRGGIEDAAKRASNPTEFQTAMKSWFVRFKDPRTEDAVLKLTLGENYPRFNAVFDKLKSTTPKTIDQTAKEIIKNLEQRSKQALGRTADGKTSLSAALEEGEKTVGLIRQRGFQKQIAITKDRDAKIRVLQKEFDLKLKQFGITRESMSKHGMFIGQVAFVHGVVTLNIPVALAGTALMLSAPHLVKLMNSARGLQLLSRALRIAPGTVEASANARLIQNFFQRNEQ